MLIYDYDVRTVERSANLIISNSIFTNNLAIGMGGCVMISEYKPFLS